MSFNNSFLVEEMATAYKPPVPTMDKDSNAIIGGVEEEEKESLVDGEK
jgi:hypothetical protein